MLKLTKLSIILLFILLVQKKMYAQVSNSETIHVEGVVIDKNSGNGLPYTNIYVLHNSVGVISNENGFYSLNVQNLELTDTLRFQYVGYQDFNITIGDLKQNADVELLEKVNTLGEMLIFGAPPNPKSIVKKVLENQALNYETTSRLQNVFIRERQNQDIKELEIDFNRSSLKTIDASLFKEIEQKVSKDIIWYTDFLGNAYFSKNEEGKNLFKINPIKVVSMQEEGFGNTKDIEKIFTDLAKETYEEQYWKIKTGIFSQKINLENDSTEDSLADGTQKLKYYKSNIRREFKFQSFENENHWEFLHKTGKYDYTLVGGSRVNNENVYIIDFVPDGSGIYQGRLIIAFDNYALIRADFNYAEGKTGRDINILGVGYSQNQFEGSIFFEKQNSKYHLKYLSKQDEVSYSVERKMSLLKKQERWLFDKELEEIKLGLNLVIKNQSSVEVLVLETDLITLKEYNNIEQQKLMKVIYVDQFNDELWEGFSIIQPTKQMKTYTKIH